MPPITTLSPPNYPKHLILLLILIKNNLNIILQEGKNDINFINNMITVS